jgi:hypothetical protein
MNMRRLLLFALLLTACRQRLKSGHWPFATSKDYTIVVPPGWREEHMTIPLDFAPEIPYVGTEDAYFPQGWGNSGSHEYWTYAFVWRLDGAPTLDAGTLKQNLTDYYRGLVGRNIQRRGILASALVPISATLTQISADPWDSATYTGTIHTLDYMTPAPMTLYCRVSVKASGNTGHTLAFFQISPYPYRDSVWLSIYIMDTWLKPKH